MTLPAGVKIVTDPETVIVSVKIAIVHADEEEGEELEAATEEPEVIGRKAEEGKGDGGGEGSQ